MLPLPPPSAYHSQRSRGSPADGGNVSSGVNLGLLASVTLRRQVNSGSWSTVRQDRSHGYIDCIVSVSQRAKGACRGRFIRATMPR